MSVTRPRVLVTGASGMLGGNLCADWADGFPVYATGGRGVPVGERYMSFDLLSDDYRPLIDWAEPEVIVHCAALTNVDACEADPATTMRVNRDSLQKLAEQSGAFIVFISTDAVFSGQTAPVVEDAPHQPQNAYGRSKAEAEDYLMRAAAARACIVRTTPVGTNHDAARQSFAEWIVRSLRAKKPIGLFADNIFTPLTVWRLGRELRWLIEQRQAGVFHVSGGESASKHRFGVALAQKLGLDLGLISETSMRAVDFKAKRSPNQTLATGKYEALCSRRMPTLAETVDELSSHF